MSNPKPKRITVSFTMTEQSKLILERIAEADRHTMSGHLEWLIEQDLHKRGPAFARKLGIDYETAELLPPPLPPIEDQIAPFALKATEADNFWTGIIDWATANGYRDTQKNSDMEIWCRIAATALNVPAADIINFRIEPAPGNVPTVLKFIISGKANLLLAQLKIQE